MVFLVITALTVLGGVLAGEHFHSYLLGFGVASTAVGVCYWITFRSTHYPQFALFLLLLGVAAKMTVTAAGVLLGLKHSLITSRLCFLCLIFSFCLRRPIATFVTANIG